MNESSLIKLLAYFDIFQFPLQIDELKSLLILNENELFDIIHKLDELDLIIHNNKYAALSKSANILNKRIDIDRILNHYFRYAKKNSKLISRFPFVRGVYISGSLSKGWADKNSDIDYFIITSPNRLWVTRSFLVLYKKLFLLNSRRYFCVNYFITEDQLEIPDNNMFTAIEILFLKPMINLELYKAFQQKNDWVKSYIPGNIKHDVKSLDNSKNYKSKIILENILNGNLGEWLDRIAFKVTLNRWKRKFHDFDPGSFDLNLRSKKHVSKHHPQGFQKKVLEAYEEKIHIFEETYNVQLS